MAIGDVMPIYPGMQQTLKEDFSTDRGKLVNTKHIWARETNINDEGQYYHDQVGLAAADETVFIDGSGNLVLRTIPRPSYLDGNAKVVLNDYLITAILSTTVIEVSGINYYDQTISSNLIGIGPRRDASGYIDICGQQMAYASITDISSSSTASTHRIVLTSAIPAATTVNDTNCRAKIYRDQPYISGMVTSQNTVANGMSGFSQLYGRFGARIQCSKGMGHFPAFWLWPDYEESSTVSYASVEKSSEKDIWEILGHAADYSYTTLHQPGYDMRPGGVPLQGVYNGVDQWKAQHMQQFRHEGIADLSPDFSAGFYWVYIDWFTDNTFAWYFEQSPNSGNIREVANSKGAPPYVNGIIDPSMLVFNNAIDSNWALSTAAWDTTSSCYTNTRSFPLDFKISDVCVWQWEGQQVGGGTVSTETTTGTIGYTNETVIGPFGTIDDVVVCLPEEETDRQGTIHEIEAKVCYRPYNIPVDKIGINWFHTFPAPFNVSFVDGSDKQWRVRIHLTTQTTEPLPSTLQGSVYCQVYLIP